jgi:uracil-DNA glycosylase family 4
MKKRLEQVKQKVITAGFKDSAVQSAIDDQFLFYMQRKAKLIIANCIACDLKCDSKVFGCGSTNSPLMIVGENPEEMELETNIPFIGPAGTLLITMLSQLGIYKHQVYLTNAVKCNKLVEGCLVRPNGQEISACSSHLIREIQLVQPKVILSLGNIALRSLTFDFGKKVSEERGKTLKLNEDLPQDITLIPTYNPSYLLDKDGEELKELKKQIWQDVNLAYNLASNSEPNYNWSKKPKYY